MVTMVATPELMDYQAYHQWLDLNAPGWTWKIPRNQASVSMTIQADVASLEWVLSGMVASKSYRFGFPPVRVHYKFATRNQAILAKLTWGHMRSWR